MKLYHRAIEGGALRIRSTGFLPDEEWLTGSLEADGGVMFTDASDHPLWIGFMGVDQDRCELIAIEIDEDEGAALACSHPKQQGVYLIPLARANELVKGGPSTST